MSDCRHRQSSYNSCARYERRSVTSTFTDPTREKNLIVVQALVGGGSCGVNGPSNFTLIRSVSFGQLQLMVWYREGAPTMNSVTVSVDNDRSLQVLAMEFDGAAQSNSLEKVSVKSDNSNRCRTGSSGTTTQADAIVVACVANTTTSCSQSGFSGGLTRFFEQTSPQYYGRHGHNDDNDRTRMSTHMLIAKVTADFNLECYLSSSRDWIAIICTFKGGSLGPKKLVALGSSSAPAINIYGTGTLTAFGPLTSSAANVPAVQISGDEATMFPFDYQYRLNGVLTTGNPLVDDQVPYRVISHEGLYGYGVRTSDDDQPRGDGALRGVDLQSAREVRFEIEITDTPDGIERQLDALYRVLIPQRDTDWPLIWRHPGQSPRMVMCRPTDLPRAVDRDGTIIASQTIGLRCADPRHYSAIEKSIMIPVTPAGALVPLETQVVNVGNVPAFPVITITGPTSGPAVTSVELVNVTGSVTFLVQLTLQAGSIIIGDMQARITGAPRSVVTLDGQSKYGSWQLPRDAFRLEADPLGQGGYNVVYLKTVPAGAPITCRLDYRDTWSG